MVLRTALLAVLLLVAGASLAQTEAVIESLSVQQLKTFMSAEGYAVHVDDDGDLIWKIEGFNAVMFVADDQESLQFYAAFTSDSADLAKVNMWNRTKRYSRSYLDGDGDPCLELDLDLAGGVMPARIQDFIKTCRLSFEVWLTEVVR